MILVDTSVWIDFLRATPGPSTEFLRAHVGDDAAVSEPIVMELLAGARPGSATDKLEKLVLSQSWCRVDTRVDYRDAAIIYQVTRATGHPVRSLQDCLLAAVAMRHGVPLAHRDADFAYIAAATDLAVIDLRSPW